MSEPSRFSRCLYHPEELVVDRTWLCHGCLNSWPHRLVAIAETYEALVEPRKGDPGDYVSGSRGLSIPYGDGWGDARSDIIAKLASWCGWLAEACAVTPPQRRIFDLAAFLGVHVRVLATNLDAIEELDALASYAGMAYPGGTRSVERVTLCPVCGAPAKAILRRPDSLRASTVTCSARPSEHSWDSGVWLDLAGPMATRIDTQAAAVALRVDPDTVYYYASAKSRNRLPRGDDGLFALDDVQTLYRELWGDPALQ